MATESHVRNIIKRTTLIVRDMAVAKRWYEEVLSLKVWMETDFTLSGQGLAAGKAGDQTRLVILQAEDPKIGMIGLLQWVEPTLPAPPIPDAVTYGLPTFVVETDDAAEIARRATLYGGRVFAEPREWSTRGARGEMKHFIGTSVFDPDGYFYEANQVVRIEEPDA
ncbi:MAG: VOC family protein [Pseudomonadota bacterium]